MSATLDIQMTRHGLVIPRDALEDWDTEELEAVRLDQEIVIRPKPKPLDERSQVRQVLREAGLLYEPDGEPLSPPTTPEERAELAKKLGAGGPLSELVIAERRTGW